MEYLDLKAITPMLVQIFFGGVDLEILVYIEDRRKVVGRTLESNMLAYDGPILKILNAAEGQEIRAVMSLSQQIYTDQDKNTDCQTYPNKKHQSYEDCDKEFVSDYIKKKMGIMPFWVTDNLDLVTEQRLVGFHFHRFKYNQ